MFCAVRCAQSRGQSSLGLKATLNKLALFLGALISVTTIRGGGIINPDAPTVSITRGLYAHGEPVLLAGTYANPPTIFTWTETPQVSGTRWGAGETVTIHLFGPLNTLGVAPGDLILPTFFPPGPLVPDSAGNFTRVIIIPNGQRPGNYLLHAVGSRQFAQNDDASVKINICPQTVPRGEVQWPMSRGGRDGQLGDHSPERTDPEWISTWSETPVGLYATIAATIAMPTEAANQPSFISHADLPYTHYAHDWNMELLPDPDYLWVLGTANFNTATNNANYARLECEWETQNNGQPVVGSYGHGNIGLPLWATPSTGDRIYMVGRWNMDNGHPDTGDRTEIHPVRMLATTRQRNTAVPLPPTGCMTRASQTDIYVSGHGGGANQFPDELSHVTDNNGLGGGHIEDALNADALAVYFAFGPAESLVADVLTSLSGGDDDLIKTTAGPSAFGWLGGPEERPVNDMDYDFDVPLPPAPMGATQPRVNATQHFGHTTSVHEVITYINPNLNTNLPTVAHIHLPFHNAPNGVYAKTLNFYWDKFDPPGRHFVVKMNNIGFFGSGFSQGDMTGRTYLWTDICGQWVFLSDIDPHGFLDVINSLTGFLDTLPPFDVYVDPNQTVRVFTQGYDQEDFDGLFGADVGKTAYEAAVDLAEAYISAQAHTFGKRDGENVDLGGALYEGHPIPLLPAAGGILGHHVVEVGFFYMDFTITYVREPHLDVTETPVDFGAVPIGGSQDRIVRIANAAVGIGDNNPYINAGVDTLTVDSLTVSGSGFSIVPVSLTSVVVDAGQHQDITVRFTPTSLGQGVGTLTLHSNDPCQPIRTVSLTATVIAPQLNVSAPASVFPPTVVGCMSSAVVTLSNTGTAELIVKPGLTGDAYTLNPYLSSGDGIHLAPGISRQLTVNFAPTSVARAVPGNLLLPSNDSNAIDNIILCGEGTPTGIRVLVLQPDGVPYPSVDEITLHLPTGNVKLKRVPLTVIQAEGCAPIQFHYEAAIPPNPPSGMVEDNIANRKPRGGPSTLSIKIKKKHQTFTLNIEDCDFIPIVVTM